MIVGRITQAEIQTLIAIDLQVRRLRKRKLETEQDILKRILQGASVEPGVHTVSVRRRSVRRGYIDQLFYR